MKDSITHIVEISSDEILARPNDADLGNYVRKVFNSLKSKSNAEGISKDSMGKEQDVLPSSK